LQRHSISEVFSIASQAPLQYFFVVTQKQTRCSQFFPSVAMENLLEKLMLKMIGRHASIPN